MEFIAVLLVLYVGFIIGCENSSLFNFEIKYGFIRFEVLRFKFWKGNIINFIHAFLW